MATHPRGRERASRDGERLVSFLAYDFMRRALLAALLIGIAAPSVGTFLVQRRLSLIGDGLGHVALAGVAFGLLTGTSPVWVALAVTVIGAAWIELLRVRGRANGDIGLALLFYGGIAGGVVIVSKSSQGTPANLNSYLFGSITTTEWSDIALFAVLASIVIVFTFGLRRLLFAVSNDEEWATAAGIPVVGVNLVLAVLTAVTVVVAMRVVGLLLVSALMIVPVATAQVLTRSFAATMRVAVVVGVTAAVGGVVTSYFADTPSGGTIVLVAIGAFIVAQLVRQVAQRPSRSSR